MTPEIQYAFFEMCVALLMIAVLIGAAGMLSALILAIAARIDQRERAGRPYAPPRPIGYSPRR